MNVTIIFKHHCAEIHTNKAKSRFPTIYTLTELNEKSHYWPTLTDNPPTVDRPSADHGGRRSTDSILADPSQRAQVWDGTMLQYRSWGPHHILLLFVCYASDLRHEITWSAIRLNSTWEQRSCLPHQSPLPWSLRRNSKPVSVKAFFINGVEK